MRKTMENKNEKSMTLEEMISEMLKEAKGGKGSASCQCRGKNGRAEAGQ